ncbi:hypothetical protein CBP51_14870 [Cellvibrio mixtus]|uniref:Glycosyl transferase family 1 n=1 Tax=Cellvibrio mixtus TaxID=39650 RepID=A0A266Q3P7_9GAMM|nr:MULTISPECIES: glycosyltransferase family 4 protein [Cellvibrio]AQT58992.1 hypothetical protein B0D95_01940 [Cellvibrio sp. PSBB023]OZY84483.1 hypothetical protein CBP51_14870 [Cellvibrio mixtus]
MKVLFIKQYLDRSELDLVLRLHSMGVYIRVLSSSTTMGKAQLMDAGIYIESRRYKSKIAPGFIWQVRQLLNQYKFDIIHSTDGKGLANAIWASYFKTVKIIGYRGTLAKVRPTDPSYWLGLLNPKVDHVVCVNRSIYDYMHKFYPAEKLTLNYKGYSLAWAEEAANEQVEPMVFPPGAFVVGYIATTYGRPHKGLGVLVQAMHLLKNPNIHLLFVGSYDNEVKTLATQGAAGDRIHFIGPRKTGASYLRYIDAFVLPSLRDGLPRAVKEAMAQAVPIITTNITGPTELVIHEESGLWVEPDNPAAIAQAITRLYESPALCKQLGDAGRQRLIDHFSAESFVAKTYALYQRMAVDSPNK